MAPYVTSFASGLRTAERSEDAAASLGTFSVSTQRHTPANLAQHGPSPRAAGIDAPSNIIYGTAGAALLS